MHFCLYRSKYRKTIFTLVFTKRPRLYFSVFTMSDLIEQRNAIKFCFRNEISAAETLRMLRKAFGNSTMSQKNAYKWYKDFKEGRERVDDFERSGRPSTSTDDQHANKVKDLVLKWRQVKVVFITKAGKATHSSPKDFRPISLSSFLLKTLARVIELYLQSIINPNMFFLIYVLLWAKTNVNFQFKLRRI